MNLTGTIYRKAQDHFMQGTPGAISFPFIFALKRGSLKN